MKPGWYPDPEQAQTVRYFDGQVWTAQTAPQPPRSGFGAGLIAGALLPLLGLVWGLAAMLRGFVADGLILCFWALSMAVAWGVVLMLILR